MPKKKRDGWGENGFEDWGGYMAAKKAKLEEQFRDTAKKEFKESKESSQLFKGIAIFVNGYTEPTSDELRRLMMMHGGIYHHYMRPKITTHIIASNLPYSKIMLYKKSQNPIPICKPQWIIDSIAAGSVLNFQNYLLYSNSTDVQPQLAYKLNNKSKDSTNFVAHNKPDNIIEKPETSVNNKTDINRKNSSKHNVFNDASKEIITNSNQSLNTKTSAQSTKDAEFLSTFYSNSRLHYISTMGTMFKDYVNELRDKSNGVFSGLERLIKLNGTKNASTSVGCELDFEDETICFADKITTKANDKQSIIMHIDMDCFFVSVGIKNRPELQNVPVAVTHAKGNTFSANYNGKEEFGSMSEVASCSYAARKAGVKNGMFLGEALKLCPNLTTIQYDFEGYKEVSYILYDTVASYTLDIEAVSCDEMYVDCTKILETSGLLPLEFATIIRNEIKQKTGCPVSTGFGNNKLQARLATRKAKPDNQFYFSGQNAETYIRTFNIRDLPGVGGTTSYKLHKMNVRTCEDLQRISLGVLQKEFGKKMGEQLYKMCRGIDDTKLNLEYIRKSVSAEVNYGIRFQNNGDAVDFLSELSVEVCNRLTLARAKGRCITLKLMVRAEEAPKEAAKFMGHGLCNYITKSKNLIAAVNDINIIKKEVINIWNQLHLIPEDMRGIGIQISRLEMYKTKQAKSNLINFFNKTKKSQQTYDKMLEDDNKDHCVSEKSKLDCSEMSPTTKPSLERKICDAEINNLLPESAKNSELIDSAIPIDVQVEPLTAKLKNKSKVNENTRAKDLFEKSNKKVLQKQTSQENFFKQVKPNSGKLSKCDIEIPQIQDIDMSVLIELPTDIRNEILDEYKRNKKQSRMNTTVDSINEMLHDEENTNVQNCSQVDPDTLLALMESNLHPDVQRDVQMYCNMKKKTNRANFIETNKKSDSKQLQEVDASKISDNKENAILNVNSICKDKAERIAPENTMHAADQLGKNGDTTEANHIPCQINRVETSNKNIAINKTDICILQNLSILHNNEKVDKHQEMLINLVNHLFTLPLQQIKLQIQTWVTKSNIVNEVDFLSLATFLSMLPEKKRIEDLHVLLKTMYRCTTKTGNCIWHRTYRRTVKHVQRYMQIEYNNNLMIPLIRCNDPRCNNN